MESSKLEKLQKIKCLLQKLEGLSDNSEKQTFMLSLLASMDSLDLHNEYISLCEALGLIEQEIKKEKDWIRDSCEYEMCDVFWGENTDVAEGGIQSEEFLRQLEYNIVVALQKESHLGAAREAVVQCSRNLNALLGSFQITKGSDSDSDSDLDNSKPRLCCNAGCATM